MVSDNLQTDINRGTQAKALLENPLLNESVDMLKKTYADMLFRTNAAEADARERLYVAHGLIDHIYAHLRVVIDNGKIAFQQLEKLKKRT